MNTEILALLAMTAAPAFYEDGRTPRGRYGNYAGATRKGATHKHGKPFKPANLLGITPAEYRRQHLGKA